MVEEEICAASGLRCDVPGVERRNGYIYYYDPPQASCKQAKTETIRIVDHYDYFVVGSMETIDTYGNNVVEYVDKAYETETKLKNMGE